MKIYPGYRSYLHLLGSDLQYLSARGSTLFSICISFISRLVISSVSFVQHQKDADSKKKIGIADGSSCVRICEFLRESLSSTVLDERLIGCGNNLFVNSKFIPTDA